MFTDTVTIYNKISDSEWRRTVVSDVQWSEKTEKINSEGHICISHTIVVTFPLAVCQGLVLSAENEEDCIVYGEVADEITGEKGSRVSDLMERYPKSGLIQSVNDNTNRDMLPHIKVVIA